MVDIPSNPMTPELRGKFIGLIARAACLCRLEEDQCARCELLQLLNTSWPAPETLASNTNELILREQAQSAEIECLKAELAAWRESCTGKHGSQQLKQLPPLKFSNGMEAEIEANETFKHHIGEIWLSSGWLKINEARQLRDWLNEVLP